MTQVTYTTDMVDWRKRHTQWRVNMTKKWVDPLPVVLTIRVLQQPKLDKDDTLLMLELVNGGEPRASKLLERTSLDSFKSLLDKYDESFRPSRQDHENKSSIWAGDTMPTRLPPYIVPRAF